MTSWPEVEALLEEILVVFDDEEPTVVGPPPVPSPDETAPVPSEVLARLRAECR